MRLIDADKLKLNLWDVLSAYRSSDACWKAVNIINSAPTINPYEWISVEDKLPEIETTGKGWGDHKVQKSVRVLCVCKQKSGKTFVKEGYYELWDDNTDPYWKIPGTISSVTHWMPLPTPPISKEN